MKKYILIIFVTMSVILTVFAQGNTIIENIEYVNALPASKKEAQEKLIFNGTVEYKDCYACTSNGIGMVTAVLVQENSFVEKGTPVIIAMQTDENIDISDIVTALTSQNDDVYSSLIDKNCKTVIYKAEASGYLRSISADKGSFYMKDSELFKISNTSDYRIKINISEKDINKVKCGQRADILCKTGDKYSGVVESISDTVKQKCDLSGQQSVIQAVIKFSEKELNVKPGYTVQCSVLTKSKTNVFLVPYSSVGNDESGESYVYLFDGKHFVKHYVVCGYEYSNGLEILSGLSENELIAADLSKVKNVENAVIGEVIKNAQ